MYVQDLNEGLTEDKAEVCPHLDLTPRRQGVRSV